MRARRRNNIAGSSAENRQLNLLVGAGYMSDFDNASNRFLGWLGRRGVREPAEQQYAKGSGDLIQAVRRHLLDEIATFLVSHRLDVTSTNLVTTHGIFSGGNPVLARKIAKRHAAGLEITQEWLDEVAGIDQSDKQHNGVELLIGQMENSIEIFSRNTNAARSATSEYSVELEGHVAELAASSETGQIISHFAKMATAMLERTRQLESDMHRSEEEAESLRRSLEKAKREAEVDHLTGLPNTRAFEAVLEREYREARGAMEPLAVAFCDIDHFKRVNDTHGHDTGDRVIRLIAETLARISDDKCHVARHGGEEFVMLFRGLPVSEVKNQLDDVRESMADRRLINRKTDQPVGRVTFSAGIADIFDYPDPRAAMKAADEALYAAKEAGRNQIHVARNL
ncbi:GGDEF domain-containing protein [Sphingobium fuliginis]|nr:GGDEF domain-containing protein [Sphingobium fuliginis]